MWPQSLLSSRYVGSKAKSNQSSGPNPMIKSVTILASNAWVYIHLLRALHRREMRMSSWWLLIESKEALEDTMYSMTISD